MKRYKSNAVRCALGLLALSGSVTVALADGDSAGKNGLVQESNDGSVLIAYQAGSTGGRLERFAHKSDLVASDCLTIGRISAVDNGVALRNHCTYRVAVSYCIAGGEGDGQSCDAIGQRKLDNHWIGARAGLRIEGGAKFGSELLWIACRQGDAKVLASLTAQGTRGECLGVTADAQPLMAGANWAVLR